MEKQELKSLTEDDFADPDTYSYVETRGGREYDVEGIGRLVNEVADEIDAPTGAAKQAIRSGEHADRMAARTAEMREEAEKEARRNARREEKIEANLGRYPGGYEVRREERIGPKGGRHDEYVIDGPYNEHVIEALREIGGHYDGDVWRVPVRTHRRLGNVVLDHMDVWMREQKRDDKRRREEAQDLLGTYGPVTVAISGPVIALRYEYDEQINGIVKRHGGRWSSTHSQWWVKMDALGDLRNIIDDVKSLVEQRRRNRAEQQRRRERETASERDRDRSAPESGRSKIVDGAVEVGDHIGSGASRKRVTGLGEPWTERANDENRYGLIGSPGGSQPWVEKYTVRYAYWEADPETDEEAAERAE